MNVEGTNECWSQMMNQRIDAVLSRATGDQNQRSSARFPPRSKLFFFASRGRPFFLLGLMSMGSLST